MKNTRPSKSPLKGDFLPQTGSPPLRGKSDVNNIGVFIVHFSFKSRLFADVMKNLKYV